MKCKKIFFGIIIVCTPFMVARAQSWQPLSNPFDTTYVFSNYVDSVNNSFFLAGAMPGFNGLPDSYIWKWNGIWTSVGSSMHTGLNRGGARAITQFNGQMVIAGSFDSIGNHIFQMPVAKWSGTEWLPPQNNLTQITHTQGGSMRPFINDMIAFDNKLFVIGNFMHPSSPPLYCFAYWDSTGWHNAVNVLGTPYPIQPNFNIYNNELYIGGVIVSDTCILFPTPGSPTNGKGLKRYNSQCMSFDFVGNWGNINIYDMVNLNGSMYIGFRGFHPTYGNNITRFDGTNFFPLGPGLNGEVQALMVYNGQLVAGGLFSADGNNNQPLNSIAIWDGNQWNPFPGGCELNRHVYHLHALDSILIATGNFDSCGTVHTGNSVIYPETLTTIHEIDINPIEITLYPNPTQYAIHITSTNSDVFIKGIELVNMIGKVVYTQLIPENTEKAEVRLNDEIVNGIYLARILTTHGDRFEKLIILR